MKCMCPCHVPGNYPVCATCDLDAVCTKIQELGSATIICDAQLKDIKLGKHLLLSDVLKHALHCDGIWWQMVLSKLGDGEIRVLEHRVGERLQKYPHEPERINF